MNPSASTKVSDYIGQYEKFLWDLLDPEGFGHSVSEEVRNEARKLLGLTNVPTTNPVSGVYSSKQVRKA